jgi:hypothetical protein
VHFTEADAGERLLDRARRLGAAVNRAVGHPNEPGHQGGVLPQQGRDVGHIDIHATKQLSDLDQQARRRRQLLRDEPELGFRKGGHDHTSLQSVGCSRS